MNAKLHPRALYGNLNHADKLFNNNPLDYYNTKYSSMDEQTSKNFFFHKSHTCRSVG